jgi:hypothetical protein
MIQVSLAETPTLKEGLVSTIRVRVENRSALPTDEGFKVSLKADSSSVQLLNSVVAVGILNAGESRIVEFQAIARTSANVVDLPLALVATLGSGRLVGAADQSRQAPVMNDYRLRLTNESQMHRLRSAGVIRAEYTITNVNSRWLHRGLQLVVRVTPNNSSDSFVVLGPNPQYLSPVDNGHSTSFVVPLLSKADNGGGTLELEVQEDGNIVQIHQVQF